MVDRKQPEAGCPSGQISKVPQKGLLSMHVAIPVDSGGRLVCAIATSCMDGALGCGGIENRFQWKEEYGASELLSSRKFIYSKKTRDHNPKKG
jgi:hypothetical protein